MSGLSSSLGVWGGLKFEIKYIRNSQDDTNEPFLWWYWEGLKS